MSAALNGRCLDGGGLGGPPFVIVSSIFIYPPTHQTAKLLRHRALLLGADPTELGG
jgi:hypothetical protein